MANRCKGDDAALQPRAGTGPVPHEDSAERRCTPEEVAEVHSAHDDSNPSRASVHLIYSVRAWVPVGFDFPYRSP